MPNKERKEKYTVRVLDIHGTEREHLCIDRDTGSGRLVLSLDYPIYDFQECKGRLVVYMHRNIISYTVEEPSD